MNLKTILVSLYFVCHIYASDLYEGDIQKYINIFTVGSDQEKKIACEDMQWEGVSDVRVYDLILADLKKRVKPDGRYKSRTEKDNVAWLARALGYSGNNKYVEELLKISDAEIWEASALKKHIKSTLPRIPHYKKWNPIIWGKEIKYPNLSGSENRHINLFLSEDLELIRLGAQKIYHTNAKTPEVLAAAEKYLKDNYLTLGSTNNYLAIDALAWLLKALAITEDIKYKPIFDEIIEAYEKKLIHRKLVSYAKKYIRHF